MLVEDFSRHAVDNVAFCGKALFPRFLVCKRRQDLGSNRILFVSGARLWTARREWGVGRTKPVVAVTFPDSSRANFYVESSNREDSEPIDYSSNLPSQGPNRGALRYPEATSR